MMMIMMMMMMVLLLGMILAAMTKLLTRGAGNRLQRREQRQPGHRLGAVRPAVVPRG
jgi:hypothetical protein